MRIGEWPGLFKQNNKYADEAISSLANCGKFDERYILDDEDDDDLDDSDDNDVLDDEAEEGDESDDKDDDDKDEEEEDDDHDDKEELTPGKGKIQI